MPPARLARVLIFILVIAFITGAAFYVLTMSENCPPEAPVRVEDGSCVPSTAQPHHI
jgi:hypothetical protein